MRWLPLPLALSLAAAATAGLAADAPLRPEQMRQAMGLKAGNWRSVSTLVELAVEPGSGDDPAAAERALAEMRARMSKPLIQDQCQRDERSGSHIPGVRTPGDCKFTRVEARDGRFALAGRCTHPRSSAVIGLAAEGTYTADRMDYRSEASVTAGNLQMRVTMDIASRFTGPCLTAPLIRTPPPKGG